MRLIIIIQNIIMESIIGNALPQYVLKYTNSDIKAIKEYLKNNGYGKFQSSTNMDEGSSILKDFFETYIEAYEE